MLEKFQEAYGNPGESQGSFMGSNKDMQRRSSVHIKETTYWEDDDHPDYLLPSNGGYNPKKKTIYDESREVSIAY